MAKVSSSYFCSECGYESQGYLGRCPACKAWNSFVEERRVSGGKSDSAARSTQGWLGEITAGVNANAHSEEKIVQSLDDIKGQEEERVSSGISELDRVLGKGFVPGSLILIAGDPGIGKSTLLLQVSATHKFAGAVLYVSGEESPAQIKLRAERLGIRQRKILLLPEICFEKIARQIARLKPDLVIIDSIQTLYSEALSAAPGSVSQVRDVTGGLLRLAKSLNTSIVLVGHVTKEGGLAGPRVLEHMVDTVLYFEGEQHNNLRILRAVKNRFGATNELGIFEMRQEGLIPLPNAAAALLSERPEQVPGAAVSCILEGSRPLLIEIQALAVPAAFGQAQRAAQGVDRGRLQMILAVMENNLSLGLANRDVFVNVIGGLKLQDPSSDLALAAALASSLRNLPVKEHCIWLGEIGLTGELRAVAGIEKRVEEALRLGIKTCIVPGASGKALKRSSMKQGRDVIFVDSLSEAFDVGFEQENQAK